MIPAGTLVLVGVLDGGAALAQSNAPTKAVPTATRARVVAECGKLPISFEPNVGQVAGDRRARDVKFLARGNGYTLFLDPRESILRHHGAALDRAFLASRSN